MIASSRPSRQLYDEDRQRLLIVYREALLEIANMQLPVGLTTRATQEMILFDNCKRIAAQALRDRKMVL
jgi:hypothetical protein